MTSNLYEKTKEFPLQPGIYQFIDKNGVILYVGRATSLRRRVSQYFPSASSGQVKLDLRIREMVELAKDVKYQQTDTLLDAIVLEANLIKKYWPKYNVKDKDDRSFIYIAISKKDIFPKPIIIRGRIIENYKLKIENFYIFGPYQSLTIIKNALKIIRRVFPYSTCLPVGRLVKLNQGNPCFDYQIGLCPGACIRAISKEDYQKNIKNIILLLGGKKKLLLRKLQKENPEKARALQHIQDVTLISRDEIENYKLKIGNSAKRIEGYDISHLTGKETYGSMVVFIDGKADKSQYRLFKIKKAPANDDLRALEEMIIRRFNHLEWQRPDLIMIDGGKPQVDFIFKALQNRHINIPIVGISKLQNDKLVFPPKTKKIVKELAENINNTLLKTRDEAHRFALKASRQKRRILR